MQLQPQDREAFERYANEQSPKEACALLTLKGGAVVLEFVPNSHHEPTEFFRISRKHMEGKDVVAILHSHPDSTEKASPADIAACAASGVTWFIYSLRTKQWSENAPIPANLPLKGRKFVYGVHDCASLVKDYYWQELGIGIAYDEEIEYGFWKRKEEPYLAIYQSKGFVKVTDGSLHKHDVILMQYASNTVNHAGVYLGNGLMLHHVDKQLSGSVPYGGYWLEHTRMNLRHQLMLNRKD